MSTPIFSSRTFARDVSVAMKAANEGTVFITDRDKPAFALLKIDDCYRMAGNKQSTLLDIMDAIPGDGIEVDAPHLNIGLRNLSFE